MIFKDKKLITVYSLCIVSILVLLLWGFCYIHNSINSISDNNENILRYFVKVKDTVEEIDKVFERSEVNVNVLVDFISNSYDDKKQKDKAYNFGYLKQIDWLIKSILYNSPGVNGAWFQVNSNLPFASSAYNWYEVNGNQFINVKNNLNTSEQDRQMNPDDDPYYFNAIYSGKIIWSSLYQDADTKESMITVSAPVYKNSILVGVAGMDISANTLQQILQHMRLLLGDVEIFLMDPSSKVVLYQSAYSTKVSSGSCGFVNKSDNDESIIDYNSFGTGKTAVLLNLSNNYKLVISVKRSQLFNISSKIFSIVYGLFILLILTIILIFIGLYKFSIDKHEINRLNEQLSKNDELDENNDID